jgi:hypothetical protein
MRRSQVIRGWFELVLSKIAKYGIQEADINNSDEIGFMAVITSTATVVTSSDRRAKAKIVQPASRKWVAVIQGINSKGWTPPFVIVTGHESPRSDMFEGYCKERNIIILCMPPHSSHLLQPLDFNCLVHY